jgi:hypothetical protein
MSDPEHTAGPDDTSHDVPDRRSAASHKNNADTQEQRLRPRQLCGTITLIKMSLPAAADTTYFAWVHDISESGIGLDMLGRLGIGVEIALELKGSDDTEHIRLHAKVIHATQVGSLYRLGCRFVVPLRPSVLARIMRKYDVREG